MAWQIEIRKSAEKEIKQLDKKAQSDILRFLRERVVGDPRQTGKALKGEFGDLWRYRVGNYRIICDIQDEIITVLVLRVGHRKDLDLTAVGRQGYDRKRQNDQGNGRDLCKTSGANDHATTPGMRVKIVF